MTAEQVSPTTAAVVAIVVLGRISHEGFIELVVVPRQPSDGPEGKEDLIHKAM
jgi:hypothetical protein